MQAERPECCLCRKEQDYMRKITKKNTIIDILIVIAVLLVSRQIHYVSFEKMIYMKKFFFLFVAVAALIYINVTTNNFLRGEYIFYKSVGVSSFRIVKQLLLQQSTAIILFQIMLYLFGNHGDILHDFFLMMQYGMGMILGWFFYIQYQS